MSFAATLAILLAAFAVAALANYRERRPREVGKVPLISYSAIQMVAVVVAILMLAHLVSLLMGSPLKSRFLG
jgi:uncharacterized membrane protein YjjB (DUF3815 family)